MAADIITLRGGLGERKGEGGHGSLSPVLGGEGAGSAKVADWKGTSSICELHLW